MRAECACDLCVASQFQFRRIPELLEKCSQLIKRVTLFSACYRMCLVLGKLTRFSPWFHIILVPQNFPMSIHIITLTDCSWKSTKACTFNFGHLQRLQRIPENCGCKMRVQNAASTHPNYIDPNLVNLPTYVIIFEFNNVYWLYNYWFHQCFLETSLRTTDVKKVIGVSFLDTTSDVSKKLGTSDVVLTNDEHDRTGIHGWTGITTGRAPSSRRPHTDFDKRSLSSTPRW